MMNPSRRAVRAQRRVNTGILYLLSFLILLLLAVYRPAIAAGVPVGFADAQIASGLNSPTALTVLPDGRVLVVQQNGVIRIIKDDAPLPDDFYAVPNVDSFAERGCLGITSDPAFMANHYVYVFCTITDGGSSFNRILRLTAAGDRAVPGSEQAILTLPAVPPGTQWHMGGGLRFGTDGKLYVAVGGHEDTRMPFESSFSQNLSSPFGKILRINPDGSIPGDNPYVGTPGAYAANFNIGLRNPFALDIQPGSGRMYINDVGAGSWEEINQGLPGANYGWPAAEGPSDDSRFTNAVHAYTRSDGCAITGGVFYNPLTEQFPAQYVGKYFFSDFCQGYIRSIDPANPEVATGFATDIDNPVNLAVAPDGSLYYLARNQGTGVSAAAGTLGKITFTNSQAPNIVTHPQSQTIFLGDPVTFSVSANGATGIQWRRNGVDIPGATAASYTIPSTTMADHQASFTAVARNDFGSASSRTAVLSVTTNRFPAATVTVSGVDGGFAPGDTLTYSGNATDAEDGALPASAFTWQVDFMHDTHTHPFMAATSGTTGGTLAVPSFEAEAANAWLRVSLTVTDSAGQSSVITRDIYPRMQLSDLRFAGTPINGLGQAERNKASGGGTMTLDRIPYAKGLGVHAPSDLRYTLNGACSGNLVADVGVDDSVGAEGSVVFQVWRDGAKVFDSGLMRGSDLRKTVNLSVAGANELRLVVEDGGDGNTSDRANWAGARVTGCTPGALQLEPVEAGGGAPIGGGGGPALAPPSGGGGCSISRDDRRSDASLMVLLAVAAMALLWRRRRPVWQGRLQGG